MKCSTSLRMRQIQLCLTRIIMSWPTPRSRQRVTNGTEQLTVPRDGESMSRHQLRTCDILLRHHSHGGRVRKRQMGTERRQSPLSAGIHSSNNGVNSFSLNSRPDCLSLGRTSQRAKLPTNAFGANTFKNKQLRNKSNDKM